MKERRKEGLRSRQEQVANEILMHFRSQKKLQGEVSLSDTMESGDDGNSLSLMDVIAVDDNMLEELDTRDACRKVRRCVEECLDPRERARLRDHIYRLAQHRIVLLATHIVSDIEAIADSILLLRQGKLLRSGTSGELIASLPADWTPVLHAPSLEDVYLYYLGEDGHV